MELSDLNADERLALVALIKSAALADGSVSEDEGEILAEIVDGVGEESYNAAVDAFDKRFTREADVRQFLQGVQRQEARELIYGTVMDLAMADVVSGEESPLLRWLATTWNVEATIENESQDG